MFELLIPIVAVLIVVVLLLYRKVGSLEEELGQVHFDKKSQSVKYGRLSEQFMPFLKDYPYDPQQFRFIGTPIDGILN